MADEVHLNLPDTTPSPTEILVLNPGLVQVFPIEYQIPPVFTTGVGYMQVSSNGVDFTNISTTPGGTFSAGTNPFPVDGQVSNTEGSFVTSPSAAGVWFLRCYVLEVDPGSREFYSNVVRCEFRTKMERDDDYIPAARV